MIDMIDFVMYLTFIILYVLTCSFGKINKLQKKLIRTGKHTEYNESTYSIERCSEGPKSKDFCPLAHSEAFSHK